MSAMMDDIRQTMGTLHRCLERANDQIAALGSETRLNRQAIKEQTESQKWNARLIADQTAALASIEEAQLHEMRLANRYNLRY